MPFALENWDIFITKALDPDSPELPALALESIQKDHLRLTAGPLNFPEENEEGYVRVPFKVPKIYLLHKSFLNSECACGKTYKGLLENTGSYLINKNQKGFRTATLQKCNGISGKFTPGSPIFTLIPLRH